MAVEDQILALLKGRKVFDGTAWHVYDDQGAEIADHGGVLWRGVHGFLINSQNLVDTAVVTEGGGVLKSTIWDFVHQTKEQRLHHDRLIEEDRLATEFILTILTSGIIYG